MKRSITRQRAILLVLACAVALAAAGAGYARFANAASKPIATKCGTASGGGCAPVDRRIDLAQPRFTNPTAITHPLFPASEVTQTILLGNVDGHPLRVEYTLLPGVKTIAWNGQRVDTRVVQYVAWLDGRIKEVALDWYAQADDGAVWYFGEDVFNYENGVVADTDGSWLAGKDGPAAMIMPANPQVGDVYRPENIPDVVLEEVTITAAGRTVDGPQGPVTGAIVAEELHMDGICENKTFAPGYGEFASGIGGDLEALAVAVPTDALDQAVPAELDALSTGAADVFAAAQAGDWEAAATTGETMTAAWEGFQAGGDVPPLLAAQMNRALDALTGDALAPAVDGQNAGGARKAAIDVAQAALDLRLRYRTPAEIDTARFGLWVDQLIVDSAADDPGALAGDVATLEQIRDRIAHRLASADLEQINRLLDEIRTAADDEDLAAAAETGGRLHDLLTTLHLAR